MTAVDDLSHATKRQRKQSLVPSALCDFRSFRKIVQRQVSSLWLRITTGLVLGEQTEQQVIVY